MKQIFDRSTELSYEMKKIHKAWYTRDDMVKPLTLGLKKEQIEKN